MKKIITGMLSIALLLPSLVTPVAAASVNTQLDHYFSRQLTSEDVNVILRDAQTPDAEETDDLDVSRQEAEKSIAKEVKRVRELDKQNQQKPDNRPDPQRDLETYFLDNEILSSIGELSAFENRQQELAAYIRNSDWKTHQQLSQGDRALALGLLAITKFLFSWISGGLLDKWEAKEKDLLDDKHGLAKEALAVSNDILEASKSENHAVDYLYKKIQNNAFYVVILNQTDFKKVITKYPEVAFLFEDLYTFFRWRYELRARESNYRLNEDEINKKMATATRVNSFLGWWELANVAKWEMATSVKDTSDQETMRPFSSKTFEEEQRSLKGVYDPRSRNAAYFGRVWNNMQKYAAKERKMQDLSNKEAAEKGVGTVIIPVRGFKPSIRKTVYKSLENLSDQEVYASLLSIRKQYVEVRVRSEKIWQEFYKNQVEPAITAPVGPAWKEKLTPPTPIVTDEDLQTIGTILSLFGVGSAVPFGGGQIEPSQQPSAQEEEQDSQTAEYVRDALKGQLQNN